MEHIFIFIKELEQTKMHIGTTYDDTYYNTIYYNFGSENLEELLSGMYREFESELSLYIEKTPISSKFFFQMRNFLQRVENVLNIYKLKEEELNNVLEYVELYRNEKSTYEADYQIKLQIRQCKFFLECINIQQNYANLALSKITAIIELFKTQPLSNEINLSGQNLLSDPEEDTQKLVWKGQVNELVMIIELLISKGFIDEIRDKGMKAKAIAGSFNFKKKNEAKKMNAATIKTELSNPNTISKAEELINKIKNFPKK